jgi:membrane associated rhomboid family serine protease
MNQNGAYSQDNSVRAKTGPAIATLLLIVACVLNYSKGLTDATLSCSYDNIFKYGHWWSVFTALFVHGSLTHLLGNMLFLYLFGKGLERQIGPMGLIAVFVAGGVASMIFCCFYYPHNVPCVGASGAICTILATLMLFDPWKFSLLLNLLPMPLGVAGFTYLLVNIAGFYQDMKHPTAGGMHTAYAGHLSGFVAGIVIGVIICPHWKKNLLLSILQFVGYYLLLLGIWYYFLR